MSGAVREITLTRGLVATVDAADYERLAQHSWRAMVCKSGKLYAQTSARLGRGQYVSILMHREVLQVPQHLEVDHRDGDGLNNRRTNLRAATHQQNLCNRMTTFAKSGFRGVVQRKDRWLAYVTVHGKQTFVGSFVSATEAAAARDEVARQLHGEFAFLNFPPD